MASALLAVWLPAQGLAQPLGLVACRELRQRRAQLAAEALQAEISLVLATRRRLCPQQEALAERANAGSDADPTTPGASADQAAQSHRAGVLDPSEPKPQGVLSARPAAAALHEAPVELDYSAYLQCRRLAEQQLRRSRPVLHTNRQGFSFYTLQGARLAREADASGQRDGAACAAVSGGGGER